MVSKAERVFEFLLWEDKELEYEVFRDEKKKNHACNALKCAPT